MTVIPGHYSYVETDTQKMLPIRIAHVGAEEYFRIQAKEKPENRITFDKIILKDAIRFFENPIEIYENIMKCLNENGKLLIIHRPSTLNTLPVSNDAKKRLNENETPYMDIIKDLRSLDYDLQWDVECLPVLIPTKKWYTMLRSKFPPQSSSCNLSASAATNFFHLLTIARAFSPTCPSLFLKEFTNLPIPVL